VKIRAVMLDATGVLIDPAVPVGQTYAEMAGRYGVELPAWRLEDGFRRALRAAPARVLPGRTGDAAVAFERGWWRELVRKTFQAVDSTARFADFDDFFDDLYDHYGRADAWLLRRGALRALTGLRAAGLGIGVVSNFDHRLPEILEGLEIASFFDVVMIPSRCGAAKPDPDIFLAALALLGVEAGETVYVGHDPIVDAPGASRAGLLPLMLNEAEALDALPTRIAQVAKLGA
jgi:putative hydrolase of the HAD superfamily